MTARWAEGLPSLEVPILAPTNRLVRLPPHRLTLASDGSPPRLATALRVGFRGGALLARFDAKDDGIVATKTRRDDQLWQEDVFEVFLTPQDPPHLYYEFEVNPLGALFDARIQSPRLRRPTICVDLQWNCPGYSARVRRTEKRWSALIRIPLAPLSQEGELPLSWRANFYRVDRSGTDEFSAWSPVFRDPPDFHDATRFGRLIFPREIRGERAG